MIMSGLYRDKEGMFGYAFQREYISGVKVLSCRKGAEDEYHVIYSGKALNYLKTMGLDGFGIMKHHSAKGHKFTRLDIAIDVINSGSSVHRFFEEYEKGNVRTRVRSKASGIIKSNGTMETLYIGSMKKRNKLLRIYNKGIEQGIEGADWLRFEYETRAKNSMRAIEYIAKNSYTKESCKELIKGFCDFTHDEIWQYIMSVDPVELPTKVESEGNTAKWLMSACAPALAREIIKDARFETVFYEAVASEIVKYFDEMKSEQEY